MAIALTNTEFNFEKQVSVYHGKVRDVYNVNGDKLVMVATDRISAFDRCVGYLCPLSPADAGASHQSLLRKNRNVSLS